MNDYTPETNTGESRIAFHDWESESSLSETILSAVAASTGQSIFNLDPLYDVLDPEAVDSLLTPRPNGEARPHISLRFEYQSHIITVHGAGNVEISPTPDEYDDDYSESIAE
ncbi:HalOD1 output domain-containing protein [Haloferacaceae archaeon DSL9]